MISKTARPLTGQENLYNDFIKLMLYGKVYYKGLIGRMKKGKCMKEEREDGEEEEIWEGRKGERK